MPRDQRLFMTFPIDFPDHPKVRPLTPLAKWTFVEMNAYSRRLGLDGVIPVDAARAMWSRKALADLVASHPTRPLVELRDDDYVLRSYADHQLTNGDIEDLREKRAAAGAKGGRAKAERRQTSGNPVASATAKGKQAVPESESESEKDLTDITHLPQSSPDPNVRAFGPDEFDQIVTQKAQRAGIQNLGKLYALLADTVNGHLSPAGAVELVEVIVGRAQQPVKNVDRYVASSCRNSPDDIQWHYDRLDLGVA